MIGCHAIFLCVTPIGRLGSSGRIGAPPLGVSGSILRDILETGGEEAGDSGEVEVVGDSLGGDIEDSLL